MGFINKIETDHDRQISRDQTVAKEIMRMMQASQTTQAEELLTELLSGAPRDVEHVQKVWRFAKRRFDSDPHHNRNKLQLRICSACIEFLEKNLSFDELDAFKNSFDSSGSVLDELGYGETDVQ
jgi:hypothetical protein